MADRTLCRASFQHMAPSFANSPLIYDPASPYRLTKEHEMVWFIALHNPLAVLQPIHQTIHQYCALFVSLHFSLSHSQHPNIWLSLTSTLAVLHWALLNDRHLSEVQAKFPVTHLSSQTPALECLIWSLSPNWKGNCWIRVVTLRRWDTVGDVTCLLEEEVRGWGFRKELKRWQRLDSHQIPSNAGWLIATMLTQRIRCHLTSLGGKCSKSALCQEFREMTDKDVPALAVLLNSY